LKLKIVRKNAKDTIKYIRKVAKKKDDNELNKIEDKETEKALI
jgi:uncharacterized membrane protein (DUF106 family)